MSGIPESAAQAPAAASSEQTASLTYTAIIRTFNSLKTTRETVASLRRQNPPPQSIIIVDSGSEATQKTELAALADRFIDVSDKAFNYSYSINVALPFVASAHALIISSHTWFVDGSVVADMLRFLEDPRCAAAFCCCDPSHPAWSDVKVSKSNFDGSNGLSNRCSLIPLARLRREAFREDVFSCEDQVWAKAVFEDPASYTARIETNRCRSAAASATRSNVAKSTLNKWANEQVALAYYVDPRRMSLYAILRRLASGVVALLLMDWQWARIKFLVAYRLVKARRTAPTYGSSYH